MKPVIVLLVLVLTCFYATPLWATEDPEVDSIYQIGKNLYYDGEYSEAQKKLLQALRLKLETGDQDDQLLSLYLRLGKNERRLRTLKQAILYLEEGLQLAEQLHGSPSDQVADCLFELGAAYSQNYDPVTANAYHRQCVVIYQKLYGAESVEVGNMLMNLGINALQMGNYQDAEQYFERTFAIFEKTSGPDSQDINRIYSNMGYLYRKLGNYEKAIEFGVKALRIKLLHYDAEHPSVAKYHRNIGRAYEDMGQPEKALPYMQRTVAILEKTLGPSHATTGGGYSELANIYADLQQYDQALKLYQKGNNILRNTLHPTHPYLVGGYFNVGRVYEDQGKYQTAQKYYQEVLQLFQAAPFAPPQLLAQTQKRIALLYFKQGDFKAALLTLQAAMTQVAPGFMGKNVYENPSIGSVQNQMDFLELLRVKGTILHEQYLQEKDRKLLEYSYQTNQHAVALVDLIRHSYFSEEALQLLNERSADIFNLAIRQAFLLQKEFGSNYQKEAFELVEKSKARILWEAINAANALEAAGIPDTLLQQIRQLKQRIGELEEELLEKYQADLNTQLAEQKIAYEQLIQSLEQYNPQYFRLKYSGKPLTLEEVQSAIPDQHTQVIEYYTDDEDLFIFVIGMDEVLSYQVNHGGQLAAKVQAVRTQNNEVLAGNPGDPESYSRLLSELYTWLLGDWYKDQEGQSLVIIPHGVLHYLSFGALLEKPTPNLRSADFLVKRNTLQYAWSADFWGRPPPKKLGQASGFLGFAPIFGTSEDQVALRAKFAPLPNAVQEVSRASELFAGTVLTGFLASETAYYERASQAKILHLATHSVANDQEPLSSGFWLANETDSLEDGFLNALEIYNHPIEADLVVLSACNTGYGTLAQGEGVMSLGRAFAYAGSRSLLTSLWLANDASTSRVLDSFYEELHAGNRIDQALRQAQLKYLEQADAITVHPAFWSNLVTLGDMAPIARKRQKTGLGLAIILGAGVVFILLSWRWWKNRP